jgi:hypothetical protein
VVNIEASDAAPAQSAAVGDLTDNVWRSLARKVRRKVFQNLDTPFQEFMWGTFSVRS